MKRQTLCNSLLEMPLRSLRQMNGGFPQCDIICEMLLNIGQNLITKHSISPSTAYVNLVMNV